MRQLILTPRWIVWHLLTLGAMVTCGLLAAWQWHRAGEAMGSALNVGYGLQWPLFAVFFAVMWWRMLRMEASQQADEPAPVEAPAPVPARPAAPSPFGPRPAQATADDVAENRTLTAYNAMLAQLAEHDTGTRGTAP